MLKKMKHIITKCQRMTSLKLDMSMIQQLSNRNDHDLICAVSRSPQDDSAHVSPSDSKPPSVCLFCREWHFGQSCPCRNHICGLCGKRGHKESGCLASSPILTRKKRNNTIPSRHSNRIRSTTASSNVVGFIRCKHTTVEINDIHVKL
ncbi:unnamed protein product [Dicrocoelium dendriticum]|nr:unnamed protein product [Dicrocoelium dendriticum]